jgi:HAD superfamily hydrolase (TIGR01509 family)
MKAIIFDMDGLMIDSERLYFQAEREIAWTFGRNIRDEILQKMMGRNPIEGMEILVRELELPISSQEAVRMRNDLMRQKMRTGLRAMPGLSHIIDAFYGRLKLAISTGAQKEFLDIAVDQLGIRDKFDVLQASDEIIRGKPDPEIFLKTCDGLGLEPKECIVLEDSENGVRAARRAGCFVIAVPSEYTQRQDFRSACFIASDLFEAANRIGVLVKGTAPRHSSAPGKNKN